VRSIAALLLFVAIGACAARHLPQDTDVRTDPVDGGWVNLSEHGLRAWLTAEELDGAATFVNDAGPTAKVDCVFASCGGPPDPAWTRPVHWPPGCDRDPVPKGSVFFYYCRNPNKPSACWPSWRLPNGAVRPAKTCTW
jgi:hypothetical protein